MSSASPPPSSARNCSPSSSQGGPFGQTGSRDLRGDTLVSRVNRFDAVSTAPRGAQTQKDAAHRNRPRWSPPSCTSVLAGADRVVHSASSRSRTPSRWARGHRPRVAEDRSRGRAIAGLGGDAGDCWQPRISLHGQGRPVFQGRPGAPEFGTPRTTIAPRVCAICGGLAMTSVRATRIGTLFASCGSIGVI